VPGFRKPLPPELEAVIRARLAANPFIKFVGIQAPNWAGATPGSCCPSNPNWPTPSASCRGGVIAAMADEAVAFILYSLVPEGEMINTVEMKINFLGAVKQGDVTAEAHIAKRDRTISLGEFEVRQADRLVAKGLSTYIHLAGKK
jgi:uncharacterized protein (TIGR00369 family)